jgi:hypothetical protein
MTSDMGLYFEVRVVLVRGLYFSCCETNPSTRRARAPHTRAVITNQSELHPTNATRVLHMMLHNACAMPQLPAAQ